LKFLASQKQEEFVLSDQLPLNKAGDTLATHENRKHAGEFQQTKLKLLHLMSISNKNNNYYLKL